MAKQTVNIGSSANKGDGDPIRTAFTKVNENFTELYDKVTVLENGQIAKVQDTQGSVFGDDSTLLVDAVNSIIPASVITGTLTNNLIGDVTGNITGDTAGTHTGAVVGNITGDVIGSVFADDSTILINGTNGTIQADHLVGTLPAIDGSNLTNLPAPAVTGTYNGPTATITDYVGIDNPYEAALPQYDSSVGGWTSLKFPLYQNTTDNDVAIFDTAQGGWVNSALKTIDGNSILGSGDIAVISLATLKTEVAASVDFAAFKTRIAAL